MKDKLSQDELFMIIKALDCFGDICANTKGYSTGVKYWDLENKIKGWLADVQS